MVKALKNPIVEFADLANNSTLQMSQLLNGLARAIFQGNDEDRLRLMRRIGDLVSVTQAASDLFGRRRLFLEFDAMQSGREGRGILKFQETGNLGRIKPVTVPKVRFQEVIEDIIRREPRIAPSAQLVADVYSSERGFALARSMDLVLTRKVQDLVAAGLRTGRPVDSMAELIRQVGDFTRSYSETVYRTNISTAYSAGRMQQARDPDVQVVIGALRFTDSRDVDVRDNHRAAHGMTGAVDDPAWETMSPPLGYN